MVSFRTDAAKFRRGNNPHRWRARALSILLPSVVRTPSGAQRARCGNRIARSETSAAQDTRTTAAEAHHKRHQSTEGACAILFALSVANGAAANCQAKD